MVPDYTEWTNKLILTTDTDINLTDSYLCKLRGRQGHLLLWPEVEQYVIASELCPVCFLDCKLLDQLRGQFPLK